jgi:hypothetical protein
MVFVARRGTWANIPPRRNRKQPICFSRYLYSFPGDPLGTITEQIAALGMLAYLIDMAIAEAIRPTTVVPGSPLANWLVRAKQRR